ncbi:InlB B-repeat-containing protein [Methylococcus mesophilus]|uniref:InlB B-repeat-containing protein n=1 Tax=Methylococcus mesophilus TaxID=2993564 RepID=UPI003743DE9B
MDCGPTCQGSFAQGSVVTLAATAAPKYLFLDWSGPCKLAVRVQRGTLPPQLLCEVTLNKSKQVKAKFVKVLP